MTSLDKTLGVALEHHRGGRLDEAECLYRQILESNPTSADALHLLGVIEHQRGRYAEAIARISRAIELNGANPIYHNNLGETYRALRRFNDAVSEYQRATTLRPDFAEAHNNLGKALGELERQEEASAQYRRAIALNPRFAEAYANLGGALRSLRQWDAALAACERVTALLPDVAEAHHNLGVALRDAGQFKDAIASFEKAIELRPDFLTARLASCVAQIPPVYSRAEEISIARVRFEKALDSLLVAPRLDTAQAIDAAADAVGGYQPFYLAYQGRNDRELLAKYGQIVCTIMQSWDERQPQISRGNRGDRISIGIVTEQIRRHSVWDVLTKGLVSGLDRSKFALYGYHTGRLRDDETAWAEHALEKFVQGPLPIQRWRELILKDASDVLIYPEIGMDSTCARLAALRLAPVQIASWGHPDTTGLPTIDYYLSGELLEAPGAQEHYSETLITLPNLGCTFVPIPVQHRAVDLARLGIRQDPETVRFISCHQVFKYLPHHDEIYPRIAKRVGNCQFVFIRSHSLRYASERLLRRLEQAFAAEGLTAADYCVFLDWLPPDEFHGLLSEMHIYLDTIAFSGFTTALRALQCNGLPIATIEGGFLRSRLASALLRHIGVTETIAADLSQYVEIAARLARDSEWRLRIRQRIKENLFRAFNDPAPIRALEGFLTQATAKHRSMGHLPQNLS